MSAKFEIKDLKPINIDDLTMGEMEELEELTGMPFEAAMENEVLKNSKGEVLRDSKNRPRIATFPPIKTMMVLLWMGNRNHIEGLELADLKHLKLSDFAFAEEEEEPQAGKAETA